MNALKLKIGTILQKRFIDHRYEVVGHSFISDSPSTLFKQVGGSQQLNVVDENIPVTFIS